MIWYLIVFGIVTVWVIVDGLRRGAPPQQVVLYGVGTLVLGPVVAPYYFASRPLDSREVRQGNFAWNALKYFAVFWTIFILTIGIAGVLDAGQTTTLSGAEAAPQTGIMAVVLALLPTWLMPFVGSLALGSALRDTSASERGPTEASGEPQRPARVN